MSYPEGRIVSMFEDTIPGSIGAPCPDTALARGVKNDERSADENAAREALELEPEIAALERETAEREAETAEREAEAAALETQELARLLEAQQQAARQHALALLAEPGWVGGGPLDDLATDEVLELLAACDVLEARAAAAKRAAAATLEERLGSRVPGLRARVEVSGLAADEIAIRLGISKQRAATLVGQGELLNGLLIQVGESLSAGEIDAAKAGLFAKVLCEQPPEIACAVVDAVLPLAPSQAHDRLERTLHAQLIKVDPTVAEQRCERAMKLRRLESVRLRPDGMATMRLVAPVFDLATIYTYADASARATKATGDQRTLDQLRLDVLLATTVAALTPGATVNLSLEATPATASRGNDGSDGEVGGGDDGAESQVVRGGWMEHPLAEVESLSIEELNAYDTARRNIDTAEPAEPSQLDQVRALVSHIRRQKPRRRKAVRIKAVESTRNSPDQIHDWDEQIAERPPLVHPSRETSRLTLVLSRTHLETDLAPPCPADRYRDEFYSSHDDDGSGSGSSGDSDDIGAEAADEACQLSADSAAVGAAPVVLGRDVPHLLGFGPIAPAVARALIASNPRHLRVALYEVLEAEHLAWLSQQPQPQHDPSAALNRHIQTCYPTCIAPTCSVRSTSADTDHTLEYPVGPTHAGNLRPLCRRHHNLKTHHGHTLVQNSDGILTWVTALGTIRATQHQNDEPHRDDEPHGLRS